METFNMFNATSDDICAESDNFLNLSDPEAAEDILYGPMDKFLMTILIPVISLVGVIANGLFLYTSFVVPELRDAVTTSHLAHLAVCDLLFLLSTNVWFVIILLNTEVNTEFPLYSSIECALSVISVHWWYFTSLGLITLITIERYLAVCHPVKHLTWKTRRSRISKIVAAIWITAFVVTLTQVPQQGKFTTFCVEWPKLEKFEHFSNTLKDCEPWGVAYDIYGSVLTFVTLLITIVVNVVLYFRIIKELTKRKGRTSLEMVRIQVTRTLITNGIIFFICQLPYRIWVLDDVLDLTGQYDLISSIELESLVLTIGRTFLILNSIINPFVYIGTCRHYRQAMLKALCGYRCVGKDALVDDITVKGGFVRKDRWTTSNGTNTTTV